MILLDLFQTYIKSGQVAVAAKSQWVNNIYIEDDDLYTKRIISRIGLCSDNVKYAELQAMFHKLPREVKMFNEYHAMLVELAKQHCMKKPVCKRCPVAKLCKSFI